ncbi:MAG: glycosyltransferase [Neomegalonema sp.]|nr:glycosyltransferase [Neomegalonema sp.]
MSTAPMKLLWVFPSFEIGGTQRRFVTLAEALGPEYEHLILSMNGEFSAERLLPAGVKWRRVKTKVRKSKLVSLRNLLNFRQLLNEEHPDLLLTSNWGSIEWLAANRGPGAVPHIHFEDGFGPDEDADNQKSRRSWARKYAFNARRRAYIAPSRVLQRTYIDTWQAAPENVHLIPNGVDVDKFAASPRVPDPSPALIGSVGALRVEKRFDRLLRLTSALIERGRDVRCILIGDGPERGALEGLADELGIADRVDFVGAQGDVAPYLSRLDLYALTSDTEQMPISLVEAMASGLPVVATNVGDVAHMVAPENRAFVVEKEDESALAAAAEVLITSNDARADLGDANAQKARTEYTLERMVKRYDELFRDMIRQVKPLMLPAPGTTPAE